MKVPSNLGELPKSEVQEIKSRLIREINFIEAQRIKFKQELTEIYDNITAINKILGRKTYVGSPVILPPKKEPENKIEINVTDHAALRYLQRVKGLDVDKLKTEIGDSIPMEVINGQFEVVQLDDIGYRLAFDRGKVTVLTTIKSGRAKP